MEFSLIDPHAVEDDGKFSCNGDDRSPVAAFLRELHAPDFERRESRTPCHEGMGGGVEGGANGGITGS